MPTNAIFCSECGQRCSSRAKFCHACGNQLLKPSAPESRDNIRSDTRTNEIYRRLNAQEGGEAEKLARIYLADAPTNAGAHALLGASLMMQYRVSDAGEAFDKALELAPDDFIVCWEHAVYLSRLGRYTEAARETQHAMEVASSQSDFERARDAWRTLTQRSQGNFAHQSALPSLQWLLRLFHS